MRRAANNISRVALRRRATVRGLGRQPRVEAVRIQNASKDAKADTEEKNDHHHPGEPLPLLEEGERRQLLASGIETRRRLESLYGLSSYVTQAVLKAANAQSERRLRIFAGVALALGILLYILRDQIKAHVSEEAAELTSRTMQQESVRSSAELVGKSLAHEILHDSTVAEAAATLAVRVIRMSETKDAAKDLVVWLVNTDDARIVVAALLKRVVIDLAQDEDVVDNISSLLSSALKRPEARAAVIDVAEDLLNHEKTNAAVRDLTLRLLDRDDTREALADAFADASHQALDDPDLHKHATEFARSALADRRIQKSAGDALWNAYKYSIGLGPRRTNTPNYNGTSAPTNVTSSRRRRSDGKNQDLANHNTLGKEEDANIPSSSSQISDDSSVSVIPSGINK